MKHENIFSSDILEYLVLFDQKAKYRKIFSLVYNKKIRKCSNLRGWKQRIFGLGSFGFSWNQKQIIYQHRLFCYRLTNYLIISTLCYAVLVQVKSETISWLIKLENCQQKWKSLIISDRKKKCQILFFIFTDVNILLFSWHQFECVVLGLNWVVWLI